MAELLVYYYFPREDTFPGPQKKWPADLVSQFSSSATDPNWDWTSGFMFAEGSAAEHAFLRALRERSLECTRVRIGRARDAISDTPFVIAGLKGDSETAIEHKFDPRGVELDAPCAACGRRQLIQTGNLLADIRRLRGYDIFRPDIMGANNFVVVSRRVRELFELAAFRGATFVPVLDRAGYERPPAMFASDRADPGTPYFQMMFDTALHPLRIGKGAFRRPPCHACSYTDIVLFGWVTAYVDPACLAGRDICFLENEALDSGPAGRTEYKPIVISGRLAKAFSDINVKGVTPYLKKPFKERFRSLPAESPVTPLPVG